MRCDFKANGYRLPTEAEWEYAARGGKQSKGYEYSGSNDPDEVGWYRANCGSRRKPVSHPVGEKKANELGIHDMSGNVIEWCWDWYDEDYYKKSPKENGPKENSVGPSSGKGRRVARGGSWHSDDASHMRPTYRYGRKTRRISYNGFRIARTVVSKVGSRP